MIKKKRLKAYERTVTIAKKSLSVANPKDKAPVTHDVSAVFDYAFHLGVLLLQIGQKILTRT